MTRSQRWGRALQLERVLCSPVLQTFAAYRCDTVYACRFSGQRNALSEGIPEQAVYEVLTEQQLRERQAESVGAVTSVLGITDGEAARVLRHYKWCVYLLMNLVENATGTLVLHTWTIIGITSLTHCAAGTRTASMTSILRTWTGCGRSWGSWRRASRPAQGQQQWQQRAQQAERSKHARRRCRPVA